MAWLVLAALLLLLAVPPGRGKPARIDATGLAAIGCFAAAALWAPSVYPAGRLVPIALAWAASVVTMLLLVPRHSAPLTARWTMLTLGGAAALFALFGPSDGLF